MDYLLNPPSYLMINCLNDKDLIANSLKNSIELSEDLNITKVTPPGTSDSFDLSIPLNSPVSMTHIPGCVTITIEFIYLDIALYRKIDTYIRHNNSDNKSIIEKPLLYETFTVTGVKERYKEKYDKAKRKYDRKIRRICKYVAKLDSIGFHVYKELPVFDPNPKWLILEKVNEMKYTPINITCSVGDKLYETFLREGLLAKLINEMT